MKKAAITTVPSPKNNPLNIAEKIWAKINCIYETGAAKISLMLPHVLDINKEPEGLKYAPLISMFTNNPGKINVKKETPATSCILAPIAMPNIKK